MKNLVFTLPLLLMLSAQAQEEHSSTGYIPPADEKVLRKLDQ